MCILFEKRFQIILENQKKFLERDLALEERLKLYSKLREVFLLEIGKKKLPKECYNCSHFIDCHGCNGRPDTSKAGH